jgi:hypothetical protein
LTVTYYWRIDEVNDPNNDRWTGNIWRFRVADYLLIDNFDDDTAQDPPDNDWYQGGVLGTGAQITLRSTPPVIGEHSMSYYYTNTIDWYMGWGFYSETQTISLEPNDWDYYDVKTISLWFYGKSGNAATIYEQMNLGLEDDSNYAVVLYGELPDEEMTDVQIEEWQLWEIRTNRFTNINFSDVKKICIGFGIRYWPFASGSGTVFFDEINLFVPTCMPDLNPLEGDFNRDCTADWQDVEIMADDWLEADANLNPVQAPGDANLVGWWKLDEEPDSNVTDYAGDNNGVIETLNTNVWWVAGHNDTNALRFDGGWVSVPNGVTLLNLTDAVTVSCWIDRATSDDGKIVVKGRNDWETYAMEINDNHGRFFVRDANDRENQYSIDSSDELPVNSWIHIAGTYDGNELTLYVNGRVAANSVHPLGENLVADVNDGLVIAGRWGDDGGSFTGTIDDVRIYDYALSGGEICYIASDGDGVADMVNIANVFTNESKQVVNLRDFAKLADNWLKRQLWPL